MLDLQNVPTWLHISDLHFSDRERFDRDLVLAGFLQSLPDLTSRAGRPDFVIVSGDIANTGRKAEYAHATEFFDALLARLSLTRRDIFVVPGNHDVDRARGAGLARSLTTSSESDDYFDPGTPCLHVQERMSEFVSWHNSYFDGIRHFDSKRSIQEVIEIEAKGQRFSISLVNTASFSCGDDDNGKLWIGRRSAGHLPESASTELIRLAVMHHPFDWLHHEEVQSVKYAFRECFDFVLTGHLHHNDMELVTSTAGGALHFCAGATYQTTAWPNTAMFVRLVNDAASIFPIHFVESPKARWVLDSGVFSNSSDYTGTLPLARRRTDLSVPPPVTITAAPKTGLSTADLARKGFEADLFVVGDQPLYIEPRLMTHPQERGFTEAADTRRVPIEELVASSSSFIIEAQAEFGSSTLARRLECELLSGGHADVFRRDARNLPNYRKKLEGEFSELVGRGIKATIIVDHFDFERDDRLLKELQASDWFSRIILINVLRGPSPVRLTDGELIKQGFEYLYIWGIGRDEIRGAAKQVFSSGDEQFVSSIVSKVYDDLLDLAIPLTPANVIMYLKILYREGEFQPLNRVDIVGRYINESIRRPADIYKDSFNAKNRMDVLSAFVFQLYSDQRNFFDRTYWSTFVNAYKNDTLSEFDESAFLAELMESRIVGSYGRELFFKYSFFFAYFLGRHLSSKPALLKEFLDNEEYLRVPAVVDVVTGLSSDNTNTVEHLTRVLAARMEEFTQTYVRSNFDPLEGAIWPDSSKEEDELWQPISKKIESGPQSAEQIDLLKTSMVAEARTVDQEVRFNKFAELESSIFLNGQLLADALRNSDDIPGSSKLLAYDYILKTHQSAFQMGVIFADLISKTRYFRWGGIAFIDFDRAVAGLEEDSAEAQVRMVEGLANAIARKTANDIGTAKLSAVFKARESKDPEVSFLEFTNFNCTLLAKGTGWDKVLSKLIERTSKNSFYLWLMLTSLMNHYQTEISLSKDRASIKRLIAQVEAKRTHRRDVPGAKAIKRMLDHLESIKHFDDFSSRASDSEPASEP